jgi:hypothetical protein
VSQGVVDALEVVEVQIQYPERPAQAPLALDRLLELQLEGGPVRQSGQVVAEGEQTHLLLDPAPVRDVLGEALDGEDLVVAADAYARLRVDDPLRGAAGEDAVLQVEAGADGYIRKGDRAELQRRVAGVFAG